MRCLTSIALLMSLEVDERRGLPVPSIVEYTFNSGGQNQARKSVHRAPSGFSMQSHEPNSKCELFLEAVSRSGIGAIFFCRLKERNRCKLVLFEAVSRSGIGARGF